MTFDKEAHRQIILSVLAQMRLPPKAEAYAMAAELMAAIELARIEDDAGMGAGVNGSGLHDGRGLHTG